MPISRVTSAPEASTRTQTNKADTPAVKETENDQQSSPRGRTPRHDELQILLLHDVNAQPWRRHTAHRRLSRPRLILVQLPPRCLFLKTAIQIIMISRPKA